jgi:hypothetical protein
MHLIFPPLPNCYVERERIQVVNFLCKHFDHQVHMDIQPILKLQLQEVYIREGPLVLHIAQDHENGQLNKILILQLLVNHNNI